jgi:AcrR family transcriptional regulator
MDASRRERKKQAVRDRILAEARRLFLAQGPAATSLAEIAEAADVAAATLFNHFHSKDELVAALAARVFEPLAAPLEAEGETPAPERVAAFFREATPTLERSRTALGELLVFLVRASVGVDPPAAPLDPLRRAWSRLVFEGQRRGELAAGTEAAFLAELVVGAFAASLLHWLRDPRYPLERRMAQLETFTARALGTPEAPAPDPQHHEERAA